MSKSNHLCLYHDDADGACSAWVVQCKHPDAECVAVQYGEPVPLELAKGRHVSVVDFSYPVDGLQALADVVASLLVIDHHKTGRERLLSLVGEDQRLRAVMAQAFDILSARLRVAFDSERSGAGLTWDTLFHGEPRPWFVDYVEDRDLWRWALPESELVNAYLSSFPPGPEAFGKSEYVFDNWNPRVLIESADSNLAWNYPFDVYHAGDAILRYRARLVESMVERARSGRLPGGFDDEGRSICPGNVPITNAPVLQSEVAHELAKGQPFAAVYWDDDEGNRVWSLRSDEDGVDVSDIAKRYGGGGHPHAAGFKEDRP